MGRIVATDVSDAPQGRHGVLRGTGRFPTKAMGSWSQINQPAEDFPGTGEFPTETELAWLGPHQPHSRASVQS